MRVCAVEPCPCFVCCGLPDDVAVVVELDDEEVLEVEDLVWLWRVGVALGWSSVFWDSFDEVCGDLSVFDPDAVAGVEACDEESCDVEAYEFLHVSEESWDDACAECDCDDGEEEADGEGWYEECAVAYASGVACCEFVVGAHAVVDECCAESRGEGECVHEHWWYGECHELDGVERAELAVGEWLDCRGEGDDDDEDGCGKDEELCEFCDDEPPDGERRE